MLENGAGQFRHHLRHELGKEARSLAAAENQQVERLVGAVGG